MNLNEFERHLRLLLIRSMDDGIRQWKEADFRRTLEADQRSLEDPEVQKLLDDFEREGLIELPRRSDGYLVIRLDQPGAPTTRQEYDRLKRTR